MNKLDEVGDDFRDAPMAALYEVKIYLEDENKETIVIHFHHGQVEITLCQKFTHTCTTKYKRA